MRAALMLAGAALMLAALHAVHARNATAPGVQGPPPRLIVELAGTAPVAAQHPSGETTPAAQTPSDTKSAPAKSELFGFDVRASPTRMRPSAR